MKSYWFLTTALFVVACGSDADTRTGKIGTGGQPGGATGMGGSAAGSSGVVGSGGAFGSGGAQGNGGIVAGGGASGVQCQSNLDCPQTDCFGCPPLVCVNGQCVTLVTPGSGGAMGGSGGAPAGGAGGSILPPGSGGVSSGGSAQTGGSPSGGAGGALPSCGGTTHLPQCEDYTRHECALCDPGGCNESRICYALTSCDSYYASCTSYFTCALSATNCDALKACTPCKL